MGEGSHNDGSWESDQRRRSGARLVQVWDRHEPDGTPHRYLTLRYFKLQKFKFNQQNVLKLEEESGPDSNEQEGIGVPAAGWALFS